MINTMNFFALSSSIARLDIFIADFAIALVRINIIHTIGIFMAGICSWGVALVYGYLAFCAGLVLHVRRGGA